MLNWLEIDAGAIRRNLEGFRRHLDPGTRLGAVVKSNAYGHGLPEVSRIAAGAGADWLCVNSVEEGARIRREVGLGLPVLVMGYIAVDDLPEVVTHDLRPVAYRRETLAELARLGEAAGRPVPVHLKVETGTHRQGVSAEEAAELAVWIERTPGIVLEGVSTHFANIEDTTDHGFAESQITRFAGIVERLGRVHAAPLIRHAACSAASLLFSRTWLDLVRIGISTYGLWPSRETRVSCRERGRPVPELTPALTWKTRIAQVKPVPEGEYIGYGCTYRTTREQRIAVLPVGYNEGYDRGLSGVAHVLIRGRRAPVRGRVCMNMCMVDVTDIPDAVPEDEVVLLGRQGEESIPAEQLAAWCGTIPYEIVTRIHPGLPRIVVGESG